MFQQQSYLIYVTAKLFFIGVSFFFSRGQANLFYWKKYTEKLADPPTLPRHLASVTTALPEYKFSRIVKEMQDKYVVRWLKRSDYYMVCHVISEPFQVNLSRTTYWTNSECLTFTEFATFLHTSWIMIVAPFLNEKWEDVSHPVLKTAILYIFKGHQ